MSAAATMKAQRRAGKPQVRAKTGRWAASASRHSKENGRNGAKVRSGEVKTRVIARPGKSAGKGLPGKVAGKVRSGAKEAKAALEGNARSVLIAAKEEQKTASGRYAAESSATSSTATRERAGAKEKEGKPETVEQE